MSFYSKIIALFFVFVAACSSDRLVTGAAMAENVVKTEQTASVVQTPRIDNYLLYLQAKNIQDLTAAEKYLNAALTTDPDNVVLQSEYFSLLTLNGDLAKAYPYAVTEYKRDPQSLLALLVQIAYDAEQNNYAAALKTLDSFDNAAAQTFLKPLLKTWLQVGAGNADTALETLKSVNVDGTEALYHFHMALICDLQGKNDETETHYKTLMEKNNGLSLRAAQTYGNFLLRHENYERFNSLLEAYRTGTTAFPLVDEAFFLAGASKIGKDIPSYVPTARQGLGEAFFDIAGSLSEKGSAESAFFFVQIALDLDPNLSLARVLKGALLERLSRRDEAKALYASENEKSDIYFSAQISLAHLYLDDEDYAAAEKIFKTLAEKTPSSYLPYVELGDAFMKNKKYAQAIDAYTKAIDRAGIQRKAMWVLFYSRGTAYERNNRWDLAEKDFLQAILLNPEQPLVLNYLGYSWLERGKNVTEARAMLERAAMRAPNNGFIADSLGWAYYLTKEYKKAVTVLEVAVQLDPASAVINDHLGDAYWRVDRKREARFQWDRALTLNNDLTADETKRLERKIRDGLDAVGDKMTLTEQKTVAVPKKKSSLKKKKK